MTPARSERHVVWAGRTSPWLRWAWAASVVLNALNAVLRREWWLLVWILSAGWWALWCFEAEDAATAARAP